MSSAAGAWGLSVGLFLIGAAGVVWRRHLLAMVLGLELLMNAPNILLVYYAVARGDPTGLAVALLVIALGAAEAVVGLSLLLMLSRQGSSGETGDLRELAG